MDFINSTIVLIRSSVTRNIRSLAHQQNFPKFRKEKNSFHLLEKGIDRTIDSIEKDEHQCEDQKNQGDIFHKTPEEEGDDQDIQWRKLKKRIINSLEDTGSYP